jgi:F0F1-type ATP synthase gamma subunit
VKRIHEIGRRLRSLKALGEVVTAMKSLSAHHLREARGAVGPARAYREGVERLLPADVAVESAPDGVHGLVAFGAELGLCGG